MSVPSDLRGYGIHADNSTPTTARRQQHADNSTPTTTAHLTNLPPTHPCHDFIKPANTRQLTHLFSTKYMA
ncbi:hypothetical protein VE03_09239 [Pseudogymnoascus sp. 23342-1-I1]|nr:hypothetical protein VE03_09239 [Pseudogymnoascus sp. 23342-1-I1]